MSATLLPADSPLLTVREAAAYLRRSRRTIWLLVRDGRLACVRGTPWLRRSRVYFRREDLDRFIASCVVPADPLVTWLPGRQG